MTAEPTHPTPEELFAYRDGELPADKRALLEAHVTTCRACRELIDRVSGLEAALRQRPDPVEGDYYAALSRSVFQKVAAGAPAARVEDPARERRRGREAEEPGLSKAPGLPWAALISTMAAASAVIVVVVMLFRQGAVERPTLARAPGVAAPRGGAPAESSAAGEDGGLVALRQPVEAKRRGSPQPAAPPASTPAPAAERTALGSGAETAPKAAADRATALQEAGRANEPSPPQQLEEVLQKKDGSRAPVAGLSLPPAAAKASAEAAAAGSVYLSVIRRFGLPDVWTEGAVPPGALLKAERDLRYLYMTGGAGADSARVRLYLAEAARLRYESAPDSALYETVVHHYWRAIRLAGGQPDVARTARERLGSFSR